MLRRAIGATILSLGTAGAVLAQGTASVPSSTSWWATTAHTIINPWVTILLLVVGCFLLFVDLLTPKTWEWTGTLGVIAVGTVFAAHVTEGTGGWIGIVLMLGGVTLLLLETHVFPGAGIAAIGGLLLLFVGMFWSLGGPSHAAFALSVSAILTVVAVIAFFAYLPKSPLWKEISQQMREQTALTYGNIGDNRMFLLGRTGTAVTPLRPSGVALFDGARFDVVTEGDFLDADTPVLVTQVEGTRVVVEPAREKASAVLPQVAEA